MPPQRIVSLVPSLTELVAWLGLATRLAGRTRFCVEPPSLAGSVPALGGTKNPDIARIVALSPELVLANREENRREDVEALVAAGLEVLLTDPNSVDEAVAMVRDLGRRLGEPARAESLARDTESALARVPPGAAVPVYVAVWHNPMMGLGSQTYGHSLVQACGGRNVLASEERYPEVTFDRLRDLAPRLILLPDEPFPFDESHAAYYGAVAPARVVDGKLLWWYGPRMPAAIRALGAIFEEFRQ